MISQVDVVSGIPGSDHDAIQFLARFVKPTLVRQNCPVYNFRKGDFDRFRDLLIKIPWKSCFLTDNVDDVMWISFKDLLFTAADQCIPKVLLSRRKRVHWLSADTIRMIRRKGNSKKSNGRASRMTFLGTREYRPKSYLKGPSMTTLKSYPTNLVVMRGFFGGGLKILEADLLAFQISSTWVMLSRLQ